MTKEQKSRLKNFTTETLTEICENDPEMLRHIVECYIAEFSENDCVETLICHGFDDDKISEIINSDLIDLDEDDIEDVAPNPPERIIGA